MALPDPASFPAPYPPRQPHLTRTLTPPGLSSNDSSTASTRSSAYTSAGSALASDYAHIHVASDDDDRVGVGITSDTVVQLKSNDTVSSSFTAHSTRLPSDYSRWPDSSYSSSLRSRSSSVGQTTSSHGHEYPNLREKNSYDIPWQPVDEKDEVGLSEGETDDDHILLDEEEYDEDQAEEERTTAVVYAEEGRGLIVQGEGSPLNLLQIQPGVTHLLIASSSTPNAMPSFLSTTIPLIAETLLALDISANFLGALPPILALCINLEELNISSNPLRVLPIYLADLTNLRVLIADSTGISTLPDALADLDKLHTLSLRRNKMHALPSWLCLLPALQTLYVDGNPFQGPWKALVEPLLAKTPMTPLYPPSTPMFPLPTPSSVDTEGDSTDAEDLSDPPSSSVNGKFSASPEEEDYTITPDKAPFLRNSAGQALTSSSRPLARTRTTPNRAYYNQSRTNSAASPGLSNASNGVAHGPQSAKLPDDSGYFADHELRKMKSAGELRRSKPSANSSPSSAALPTAPLVSQLAASASSSNLLSSALPLERPGAKRFASVGPSFMMEQDMTAQRPKLTQSMWEQLPNQGSPSSGSSATAYTVSSPQAEFEDGKATVRPRQAKVTKDKSNRWGFLKKMSMGKMKTDSPPRTSTFSPAEEAAPRRPPIASRSTSGRSDLSVSDRGSQTPQINMRFSTTGNLDAFSIPLVSTVAPIPENPSSSPNGKHNPHSLAVDSRQANTMASPGFLSPPSPTPRSAKRRSFLPIDGPPSLNIPIPDASPFVSDITATNGEDENRLRTPSPIDHEALLRKEEERAREAYMRALRSVMAYLRDMYDLGLSQGQSSNPAAYGAEDNVRSRRPTVVDRDRDGSLLSASSTLVSSNDSSQLRSLESMSGLRSGSVTQTYSVATTDSSGSGSEERKFKDDKGKRAMVIKEIVLTERTYVKGLQELVDLYIKPASAQVTNLSGSSKDTVVPPAERKIVFNGVDALFSFHNDSFLPALEVAAASLMTAPNSKDADPNGDLSLQIAKAVGNIFLTHAAFMKMYSTYINNFDNAVQRVKLWTSDRQMAGNSPIPGISPSASTAQLVGLGGLSLSGVSTPGVVPDSPAASGVPILSTSQRKRIRSYLKRCRMNPRHSQLNLEGYLLLPIQRIPRYRLLLEELLRSTPPSPDYLDDPLERALAEISLLANNMNEGKREAESRRKLVQWQSRIKGRFPSPLVQPHRRLIMDGQLLLTRVVRKAMVSFEAINAQGDPITVQVDCLAPELTPRPLVGILCNDLLVLCRDPTEGKDPTSSVDLWAVLRMQTLPQPASIVHGNALRLVDNKAILYFDAPSPSDALNWYRAINLHIPASKS